MKKFILLIISCFIFSSCGFVNIKIPEHECEECKYTSGFTEIYAKNVRRTKDYMFYEILSINNSWFPGFKWGVYFKNYKRKIE